MKQVKRSIARTKTAIGKFLTIIDDIRSKLSPEELEHFEKELLQLQKNSETEPTTSILEIIVLVRMKEKSSA